MKRIIILFVMSILLTSCTSANDESTVEYISVADQYTEEELEEVKKAIESIDGRRIEFTKAIKEALNKPELPIMCEDVYFSSDNDLIIEVNGEWLVLHEDLRNDMIYALKEVLKENKILVNASGHGQFFSTSGQPLESFYTE